VGGVIYATTRKILTKYPDSMLGVMFSGRHVLKANEQGNYFIDRDGQMFRYILNFLRDNTLVVPEEKSLERQLYAEVDFFQLTDMLNHLQEGKTSGYTFSSMHKHKVIQLSSNLTMCEHTAWHVNWAAVLVRPSLTKATTPTKLLRFKIDAFDLFKAIQIGVYFRVPHMYTDTPNIAYKPEGTIVGHTKFELLESTVQPYEVGDVIGVFVNFLALQVEFFFNNKKVATASVPELSLTDEIHFGVSLWWRNIVSLVLD